jgi:hypothetical protein
MTRQIALPFLLAAALLLSVLFFLVARPTSGSDEGAKAGQASQDAGQFSRRYHGGGHMQPGR